MNNKKILFITTGTKITASSRTRVYNYKPFLEKKGFIVAIIPYNSSIDAQLNAMSRERNFWIKLFNKINHFFKNIIYLIISSRYDVIVLQRVLLPMGIFMLIRMLTRKLIFDFDDAIYMADRKKKSFLKNDKFLRRFEYTIKKCNFVITSNEALKKVISNLNSNIVRVPTPVDTDMVVPKYIRDNNGSLVIGWIGSPGATKYVKSLKGVFEDLLKKYPFLKVKLIGAIPLKGWNTGVIFKKWSLNEEVKDLQSFDIGIMALDNDEWSAAKAGYKLLQYMAVGIPCVASPVGVNREIIEDVTTGFLSSTHEEWKEKLSMLVENSNLRKKMGAEGRKKVEKFYSYKANIGKLVSVLK